MEKSVLEKVKKESVRRVYNALGAHLHKMILFGSYARNTYTDESDIDIAVLVSDDREETNKYRTSLVNISSQIDLENMVVVNFICLPLKEYDEMKSYYPFYSNIEREGEVLYG